MQSRQVFLLRGAVAFGAAPLKSAQQSASTTLARNAKLVMIGTSIQHRHFLEPFSEERVPVPSERQLAGLETDQLVEHRPARRLVGR